MPDENEEITPRGALIIGPEYDLDHDYCPCMEFHNEGYCVCGENP